MPQGKSSRYAPIAIVLLALLAPAAACPQRDTTPRTTKRDNTAKGAGAGALAGAAIAVAKGEREADEILAGAAVGAALGAGVGAYMDRQEERLARIPGTTVERVGEDMLLIRFDSDVLFAVDSAVPSSSSRPTVEEVGRVLMDYPKTAAVVQGHTDDTGTEAYNQELSERRAKAVLNLLAAQGVDATRMVALGFGEGSPAVPNADAASRARNRRVDVLLKAKAR